MQEALYRSPGIPYRLQEPSRIALLTATIARRPDIAPKVLKLRVNLLFNDVRIDPAMLKIPPDSDHRVMKQFAV
jgi:hypothetical protein